MDWILTLALGTFVLLVAFLLWTRISTKRHHESGGTASGIGGESDPLSGAGADVRDPDTLRSSLDNASAAASSDKSSMHGER